MLSFPLFSSLSLTHLEVTALAHGLGDAVERGVGGARPVDVILLGRLQSDGSRRQAMPAVEAWRRGGGSSCEERHEGGEEEAKHGSARHGCCFCAPSERTWVFVFCFVECGGRECVCRG